MSGGVKPTRIVWRPEARADRIALMEYIAQDSPLAAIELDDEIEAKVDALLDHPKLYKVSPRVRGKPRPSACIGPRTDSTCHAFTPKAGWGNQKIPIG